MAAPGPAHRRHRPRFQTRLFGLRRTTARRRPGGLAALTGLLLAVGMAPAVTVAGPVAAATPSCATAGIGVEALGGPNFYIDARAGITSGYTGYRVTNGTGAPLSDVWVRLSDFTGGSVALGNGQSAASGSVTCRPATTAPGSGT